MEKGTRDTEYGVRYAVQWYICILYGMVYKRVYTNILGSRGFYKINFFSLQ